MLYLLLLVLLAVAAWLFAMRPLSLFLDRLHTTVVETSSVHQGVYRAGVFELGDTTLYLMTPAVVSSGATAALSPSRRASLTSEGRTFPLGPARDAPDRTGVPRFEFTPDAGDQVQLTWERGLLSWPVPFETNWMTGHVASYRRSLYCRWRWTKRSGAALDVLFRAEEGYNKQDGWLPPLQRVFACNLTRLQITEARDLMDNAASYLSRVKHWESAEYQLEDHGPSADGKQEVIAALHRDDQKAAAPGAGRSVELLLDYKTRQVTREIGGQ